MPRDLSAEILSKLARAPYRYTSRQIFDAMAPECFVDETDGMRWKVVEDHLRELIQQKLIHSQNGYFVRVDRMKRLPPERRATPKKSHPKQMEFEEWINRKS